MNKLIHLIRSHSNYDLSGIKTVYIEKQLNNYMQQNGISDYQVFYDFLMENSHALDALTDTCLNNATRYFRNPELFDLLKNTYLPKLLQKSNKSTLNIQIAACSTGDEAFSLAIIIHELLQHPSYSATQVNILATDLSEQAIKTAKGGDTIATNLVAVSSNIKQQYFTYRDHRYYLKPIIKDYVKFEIHDLFKPMNTSTKFDIIICRNALLYYDVAHQEKIITNLHHHLAPEGMLVISEFELMPANCKELFRKAEEAPYVFFSN